VSERERERERGEKEEERDGERERGEKEGERRGERERRGETEKRRDTEREIEADVKNDFEEENVGFVYTCPILFTNCFIQFRARFVCKGFISVLIIIRTPITGACLHAHIRKNQVKI
jgi:hypothetical protein